MLGIGFVPYSDLLFGGLFVLFSLSMTTLAIRRSRPDDWQGMALLAWVVFGGGFVMGWF